GIYAYHCCLLIVALAALMIGYDGHRPQSRLMAFGLFAGLLAGTMWLELRPVAAFPWPDFLYQYRLGFAWGDLNPGGDAYWTGVTLIGLLDGLVGTVIGFFVGRGMQFAVGYRASGVGTTVGSAVCATLTLCGAFFGWQGAAMLAIVSLPVLLLARLSGRLFPTAVRQLPLAVFLTLLAFVLSWAYLDQSRWMIGVEGFTGSSLLWWQDWLIALSLLALACGVMGMMPSFREEELSAALRAAANCDSNAAPSFSAEDELSGVEQGDRRGGAEQERGAAAGEQEFEGRPPEEARESKGPDTTGPDSMSG
ncbi:MAG: hypothetical protein NXI04_22880, partial [Planctomycetaceae bacterium]|nr:hypothetical protein [Planctomycetaceae bacterium]